MKLRLFRHTPRRPIQRTHERRGFTLAGDHSKLLSRLLLGAGVLLLLFLVVFFSRTEPNAMASPEIRTIQERGLLRVGLRADMPGMGFEGEGLEAELADLLARRLLPNIPAGNSIRYEEVNAANMDAKMADGQIDLAIAMVPSGEKSGQYVYSHGYYEDKCYFITAVGTEKLVLQNITAGCVQNTPEAELLNQYVLARPLMNIEQVKFASYPDMLNAVIHGRVDVALMRELYITRYQQETALNPNSLIPYKLYTFRVSGISPGAVQYAIACPVDTPAIVTVANLMLEDMREDGSLARLYKKYGFQVPES